MREEIVGEQIAIRPVAFSDLVHFLRWWNDPELMREVLAQDFAIDADELERVYWPAWHSAGGYDQHMFVITLAGLPIGELSAERHRDNPATIELHVKIALPRLWNKGLGTDALRTFIRHAFDDPSVECVVIEPGEHNERMQAVCENLGMTRRSPSQSKVGTQMFELRRAASESGAASP